MIGQTPAAGEKAKKDSEVALERSRSATARSRCPNVVGQTQAEAEKTLRKANLTIGQVNPQPPGSEGEDLEPDPRGQGGWTIKEGKPIDIFTADPRGKKKKAAATTRQGRGGRRRGRRRRRCPRWRACPWPRPRRRPPRRASCP